VLARSRPELVALSKFQRVVAAFGLIVAVALALMKIVPLVPGHFTMYEWIALGVWIVIGIAISKVKRFQ
jgi:hypothetical protein